MRNAMNALKSFVRTVWHGAPRSIEAELAFNEAKKRSERVTKDLRNTMEQFTTIPKDNDK